MQLLLPYLLCCTFSCHAQSDSINSQWNNCSIDTLALEDGTVSRIRIEQEEWSNTKERTVTSFWERVYNSNGIIQSELTGSKYYKGKGYFQVKSVKKLFNTDGRRISTKRYHYKIPSFI